MNFIQYQLVAASALRGALKESAKTAQVKSRDVVHYRVRPWSQGVKGEATVVNNPVAKTAQKA